MTLKPNDDGTLPDRVITSSTIPRHIVDKLNASGDKAVQKGGEKHAYFCGLLIEYAKAWNAGKVPRAHMGHPKDNCKQQTFYVAKSTVETLKLISTSDGVSVSTVIRTAVSWHIFSKEAGRSRDVWGTEEFLGPRTKLEF